MKHKLKVTSDSPSPYSTKIFLDDQPFKGVYSLRLDFNVDDANSATIEFYPNEILYEGEVLVEMYTDINGEKYKLVKVESENE